MEKKFCFLLLALVLVQGIHAAPAVQSRTILDTIFGIANAILGAVSGLILGVLQTIFDHFQQFVSDVTLLVNTFVSTIVGIVTNIVNQIQTLATQYAYIATNAVVGTTYNALMAAVNALKTAIQTAQTNLSNTLNAVLNQINTTLEPFIGNAVSPLLNIVGQINSTLQNAINSAAPTAVLDCITYQLDAANDNVQLALNSIDQCSVTAKNTINNLLTTSQGQFYLAGTAVNDLVAAINPCLPSKIDLLTLTSFQLQPFMDCMNLKQINANNILDSFQVSALVNQLTADNIWTDLQTCINAVASNSQGSLNNILAAANQC